MNQEIKRAIIIGSGPAGFTAALYLGRANIPPLVFEGQQPGGQLTITSEVENYPGFPEGIDGPALTEKFRAQASRFGAEILGKTVDRVDLSARPFKVFVGEDTYLARSLIIATGSSARWLGLPEENDFHGKGLSACATCDGFFFRDHEIAVVGGGDTAMEEAIFLTNFAKKVTVIHRRDELRASKIMGERALANPKIEFAWNKTVKRLIGGENGLLEKLILADTQGGEDVELPVTGCFIAIGHVPNTQFLDGQFETDANGYLITRPDVTATEIEGVWACGDVQDHVYRQAITAAGTGCMAAIECERWLGEHGL
ncbi:thioredoxin-disulfide reductase [bacterium]|nr:thioredoxin-disulfide reductase [bacterium]MBU1674761.1 thioredoxin-disulfide reductase [bacterium]